MSYLHVEVSVEHTVAKLALESLLASVDFFMLAQISSLGEGDVTDLAFIRSLICMDSEVIEEVVPLPEVLVAVLMVAFQHLDLSL